MGCAVAKLWTGNPGPLPSSARLALLIFDTAAVKYGDHVTHILEKCSGECVTGGTCCINPDADAGKEMFVTQTKLVEVIVNLL